MGMRSVWVAVCLAAFVLAPAQAQDDDMVVVAVEGSSPGYTVLYVVDPVTTRLLVYRHRHGEELELEAVRNFEYDMQFEQFPARNQRPSVRDMRKAVDDNTRPSPDVQPPRSAAEWVSLELKISALRQDLADAEARGDPTPTYRGVPLPARIQGLERISVEARLELAGSAGAEALQAALGEALSARAKEIGARLSTAEALRKRLRGDHGGLVAIDERLERLRAERKRVEALIEAEKADTAWGEEKR
jgi:hypothetical protein